MAKDQPKKRDWREERRFRAWDLQQRGWKQRDIATVLGVTEGAVSQWLARARAGGVENLRNRPRVGATPRLTDEQRQRTPALLAHGAEHYGFLGDLWTSQRVAEVIERTFGVRYNPSHVRRLLYALGFSVQKPEVKATQHNEEALPPGYVKSFLGSKKAIEEGRALVYVDEAGFYLLPGVARTWAPSGQTPVLRSKLTRDHLSVMSAITGDGKLLMQMSEQSISSHECVRFLKHLVRHLGKVTVVWDGAPIHRSKVVQEHLR